MIDLRERFRATDGIFDPDLWSEVEERLAARTEGGVPLRTGRSSLARPSFRKGMTVALAFALGVASTLIVIRAFPQRAEHSAGDLRERLGTFAAVQGWVTFGSGQEIIARDPDEGPNGARRIIFRSTGDRTPIPIAWSPDGSRLLFDEGDGLRVLDGEERLTRLTSTPGSVGSWSPDGTRVAFADGSGLRVVPSDGGDSLLLVAASGSPLQKATWSPNGRWIAFLSYSRGRPLLKRIDIETGVVSRVIGLPRSEIYSVAWSPDGSRLLLGQCTDKFSCDISVVDVGTGRMAALTDDHGSHWPTWSPDGKRIAFVRVGFLFVMKADGTDTRVAASFASGPLAWIPYSRS